MFSVANVIASVTESKELGAMAVGAPGTLKVRNGGCRRLL